MGMLVEVLGCWNMLFSKGILVKAFNLNLKNWEAENWSSKLVKLKIYEQKNNRAIFVWSTVTNLASFGSNL
jgi:hypothetical protein